jgi:hypothetical protein
MRRIRLLLLASERTVGLTGKPVRVAAPPDGSAAFGVDAVLFGACAEEPVAHAPPGLPRMRGNLPCYFSAAGHTIR